jgi:hypothetical protein
MLSGEGGIEPPTRSLELTILPLNYSPYWLFFSLLSKYWFFGTPSGPRAGHIFQGEFLVGEEVVLCEA